MSRPAPLPGRPPVPPSPVLKSPETASPVQQLPQPKKTANPDKKASGVSSTPEEKATKPSASEQKATKPSTSEQKAAEKKGAAKNSKKIQISTKASASPVSGSPADTRLPSPVVSIQAVNANSRYSSLPDTPDRPWRLDPLM